LTISEEILIEAPWQRTHFQLQMRRQSLSAKAFLADDAPKIVFAERMWAHIDNTVEELDLSQNRNFF